MPLHVIKSINKSAHTSKQLAKKFYVENLLLVLEMIIYLSNYRHERRKITKTGMVEEREKTPSLTFTTNLNLGKLEGMLKVIRAVPTASLK